MEISSPNLKSGTQYKKVRAIATSLNGDRFAISDWEKRVQIGDIEKGVVCSLETDIDSGMSEAISISEDGKDFLIAGYNVDTVTLFDIDSNKILWKREDLKQP